MIVRVGPGRVSQDINCAAVLSLYEVSESCQTFKTMFVDNIKYAESFIRHFEADYGYDDHDTFFVGDGGATPKHAGTRGTACICTY